LRISPKNDDDRRDLGDILISLGRESGRGSTSDDAQGRPVKPVTTYGGSLESTLSEQACLGQKRVFAPGSNAKHLPGDHESQRCDV
jgi:hypothetical protein